ncbi:cytochrome C biogenesis protein CcmH [Marinomonas ushuaiensis DSM 15871]|uniref:Cytochrome c-type biogenesis protein n=1 Tax=Marinomonas ushuaiensis DSM 15871 TaxID=1122207 RepID=X7E4J8_9GAMM|nr:cytochrome c-type biogenesis protein [Marinomonas ushuaiensis]ETX10867.1 cytochrome C biogenesis protein CcmH [Marinomonas ushuaiensis DSM 15871]
MIVLKVFVAWFVLTFSVSSVADELMQFSSALNKTRYQSLIEELRCPKCQNQNLADSASGISVDLREQVHQMIEDRKTDQEVIDYMVARYGEFVLYRPQQSSATILLWYGPFILLGLGFFTFAVVLIANRKKREALL